GFRRCEELEWTSPQRQLRLFSDRAPTILRSCYSARHVRLQLTAMETFDVAIVGGGPAGSTCAAFCAGAGLRTLLLEREKFPREKVCGDCLNPSCWPVLRRLGLFETLRALPHGILDAVEFIAIGGQKIGVNLPAGDES